MLQFAGSQQLIGGLALLALSAAAERRGFAPSQLGVASFAYLVLIGTATAHTVSIWLAAKTNATFASSWSYVSPFVALAFGASLLGEHFGPSAWVGGVCVVAGAVAINSKPRIRPTVHALVPSASV